MRARSIVLLLSIFGCLVAGTASARLLALVVGNNMYAEVPQLQTAVDDARAMSEGLSRAGFSVTLVENGTKRQISRAMATVEGNISPGDTVLFHFSGHGFEIDGQNWLLPIDVPAAKEGESSLIKDESFSAADIIERFRARGAGTVVAILDACRNNPFAQGGTRALSGTRGLARMDADGGVFIMFSAGSKQEALDRLSPADPEKTSVFVRSFLPLIGRQDMSLIDMAKETQEKVRTLARSVGRDQIPAYYDGIVGRVTLTGEIARAETAPAAEAAPQAKAQRSDIAENIFWQSIEGSGDPAMFRAYLAQVQANAFPGTYKALAEIRLASLLAKAPAVKPPAPPIAPAQPDAASQSSEQAAAPEIRACDLAAADIEDPDRPRDIPGVSSGHFDAAAAIAACEKAVAARDAPRRSFYELAAAYDKNGDALRARPWLDKATGLGHPLALYVMAERYLAGNGVGKDAPKAMSLFYKAADAGYRVAVVRIASMYASGENVGRDYRKAAALYQFAIKAGEPTAFAGFGQLYLNGRGVARDRGKACELFRQGSDLGNRIAADDLRSYCPPG